MRSPAENIRISNRALPESKLNVWLGTANSVILRIILTTYTKLSLHGHRRFRFPFGGLVVGIPTTPGWPLGPDGAGRTPVLSRSTPQILLAPTRRLKCWTSQCAA